MVGAFLINPLRRGQSLEELAAEELNIHLTSDDREEAAILAVIRGLYEKQINVLTKLPKVAKLAENIEWPIIPVLADMEYEGIKLDTSYLKPIKDLQEEDSAQQFRLEEHEKRIAKLEKPTFASA